MDIIENYFKEIENKYKDLGLYMKWNHFWKAKEGVSKIEREELLNVFPEIPESLLPENVMQKIKAGQNINIQQLVPIYYITIVKLCQFNNFYS